MWTFVWMKVLLNNNIFPWEKRSAEEGFRLVILILCTRNLHIAKTILCGSCAPPSTPFLLSFTTCRLSFVEFMTCCQWNATQSALFCHCWHHTQIQILAQLQIQGQGQIRPRQRSWQLSDVVALLHIFSSHFQFHLCHNLKCKTQARMSGLWDGTSGDFDKCRCHLA